MIVDSSPQFGPLGVPSGILQESSKVLLAFTDTQHQCTDLRTAHSVGAGLVTANWQVFVLYNLFVAGAVVLPSSSFANFVFHAMALCHRLSNSVLRS